MKMFERAKNTLDAVRYYTESANKRGKHYRTGDGASVDEKAPRKQLGVIIAQMRDALLAENGRFSE